MPLVIFVTAYDEYAVQAFEVHALDYLLKPVERERFAEALERAKARLASRAASRYDGGPDKQQLQALLEHLGRRQRRDLRLAIKVDGAAAHAPHGGDRLDRGGGQPRARFTLVRRRISCATRSPGSNAAAGRALPAHSPLDDREHRAREGAAAVVPGRLRGDPARRLATHERQKLSAAAPGVHSRRTMSASRERLLNEEGARHSRVRSNSDDAVGAGTEKSLATDALDDTSMSATNSARWLRVPGDRVRHALEAPGHRAGGAVHRDRRR